MVRNYYFIITEFNNEFLRRYDYCMEVKILVEEKIEARTSDRVEVDRLGLTKDLLVICYYRAPTLDLYSVLYVNVTKCAYNTHIEIHIQTHSYA